VSLPHQKSSKTHPFTADFGCLNRAEPVSGIVLSLRGGSAPDLVFGE